MKKIVLCIALIALIACNTSNKKSGIIEPENENFAAFLDYFGQGNLPLEIKGCYINPEGLKEFDDDEYSEFVDPYSFAYMQIPAGGNYIAVITLQAADCLIPVLSTYKPDGQLIDRKDIAIGYCGMDCGFTCEEYLIIQNDYSIYTSDTITSCECDDLWEIIPETCEHYVIFKKGKLKSDGKIELSEENNQPLKD